MYFKFESQFNHSSQMLSLDKDQQVFIHLECFQNILPRDSFFIHGNLASNHWWYPYIEEVYKNPYPSSAQTLKGHLYLAEFRGCGKSSPPKDFSQVNMKTFANDFISVINSMNIQSKINLIGHSTGGNIAAIMLATNPELFEKAILLDPVGPRGVVFDERMIETFERMKLNKQLVNTILGMTIYNNQETDFFKEIIVEDGYKAVRAVGHLVLKAFNGFNIEKLVRKIQTPTQVLHGEHDKILDIQESIYMADLIPKAQFIKVLNHGHCLNLEDPKLFKKYVDQFFFT